MFERIRLILSRFFCGGKTFIADWREFGFCAALWLWVLYVLPSLKGPRYIKFLTKYMDKQFKKITDEFKAGNHNSDLMIPDNHITPEKKPVWVCWLQGEESMPELVKMCYNQLKKNIPDYAEIHLITLDNYSSYITLPDYIIEKFNSGSITMIHLTDIFRSCLLYSYGGMWIDSTVFTTKGIPDEFFNEPVWAQHTCNEDKYKNEPSRAKWSGFLMGGKQGNPLFCYMRNSLFHYWSEHKKLIEYIILDYSILTAYNNFDDIRKNIDDISCNNENMWELTKVINDGYDEKLYRDITDDTIFFKLTYKMELKKQTDDGKPTFYAYLLDISKESK